MWKKPRGKKEIQQAINKAKKQKKRKEKTNKQKNTWNKKKSVISIYLWQHHPGRGLIWEVHKHPVELYQEPLSRDPELRHDAQSEQKEVKIH